MESKFFPVRLQRNRRRSLSLPDAELIPQQPASPAASLRGCCGTLNQARGKSKKDSARKPVLSIPAYIWYLGTCHRAAHRQDRGKHRQLQCTGCGSPRWSWWGSLLQRNPYQSSMEIEKPSTLDCLNYQNISWSHLCGSSQTASTSLFYLKKSHTKPHIIYCQQNLLFLPHFLIYFR